MRWLVLSALLAATGLVLAVNIATAHDGYSTWRQPLTGASCCDDRDCAPIEPGGWGIANGRYWVSIDGARCPVPDGALLNGQNLEEIPPGNGHACIRPVWPAWPANADLDPCQRLLCFLPGAGG